MFKAFWVDLSIAVFDTAEARTNVLYIPDNRGGA